jgi:ParB/RepB/Spo0J family partition protein
MSERRFKSQISDVLTEQLPDGGATLERWLAPTTESKIEQIPVEQIHDRSWRAEVDTTEPTYRGLKASIRASGVLQPLLLRPRAEGGFEVVSGARRLRAARDTAQGTVPAVVRELNDVQALVGGSWDAVLRAGLTPYEARELIGRLVEAGMEEREASALVGTAPVREETEREPTGIVAAAPPILDTTPAADPAVGTGAAEAAVTTAEPVEVEGATTAVQETPPPVAAALDVEALTTTEPVEVEEPAAVEAEVPAVEAATTTEPVEVEEPAAEVEAPAVEALTTTEPVEVEEPAAEIDVEDVVGWPAPDAASTETAPTTPPTPLPVDPVTFPVVSDDAEAEAAVVEPEAEQIEAPSAEAAEAPSAEVAAPVSEPAEAPAEPAAATSPPHVIPIKLPEPVAPQAPDEEPADPESLPVAAPTAIEPAAATDGSRLVSDPVPAVRMQTSAPRPTLPTVLRRGPLFYAVLGIGLAVGAIVFILVTVLEGVGSGTAPIIAAVVVAVVGFVTAMVSLAQPRRLR